LRWIFATLVDSAIVAFELVNPPLSVAERERYYAEMRRFAAFFGIPQAALPPNWMSFAEYFDEITGSNALAVSSAARVIAAELIAGAGTWLRSPSWYRAVTASLLPDRLRAEFGLLYGAAEIRAAARALMVLRVLYPRIPARLRYVAPYQEACARLAGRGPGLSIKLLNRLWIGRNSMAG
jgi:uncharacterized protein (DUF2236 family)